jgi:nucleoside-diphosphate-sugar epimerase
MKVLVTGANGFTGLRLAQRLQQSGHEVRALVRPTASTGTLEAAGIEVFRGQLTDTQDVRAAVSGCAKVYHVAAAFRTAGHPDSYYYDVNVGGTSNVLEAARAAGCERVVHCSTGGVHGHIAEPPANEKYRFAPGDVYQDSKVAAEGLVQQAIAQGQRVVIFRPGAIYGEGDLRFLKLYRSVQNRRWVMIGSGETRLHMVHVDDLCAGIELCGSQESAIGQVFLIAGPDAPKLNEIVAIIANVLKVPQPRLKIPVWPVYAAGWLCEKICVPLRIDPPLHTRRVSFFTHHREFDISKARRLLGYDPQINAAAGIARTAAWYISQGLLRPVS